jgi:cell division protein FtsA
MKDTQPVFALDIGTRSIVGLLLERSAAGYKVGAVSRAEHERRSIFNGQIHDIAAVAGRVSQIKSDLEKRSGLKLRKAAVAAAGRSLDTGRGVAQRRLDGRRATPGDVHALELEAVRDAMNRLKAEKSFCVGYSVYRYYLEGQPIKNLAGHRGDDAAVEVIATFLPGVVVVGLLAVLEQAGLEIHTLTLEPMAALEVALTEGMRGLNLALVDIGAGTSDIALSRGGTIFAYAMVPRAGDEVTEALCEACLLDFGEGEKIKRALGLRETVEAKDVLGRKKAVDTAEAVRIIEPVVADMAQEIASTILELNGKAPDGVVMVGGGSLTPRMPEKLARALGLDERRIGIVGRESLAGVKGQARRLSGPEAVTPIGIGVWGLEHPPFTYRQVAVNGKTLRLWSLEGETVGDALLSAGIRWERLHGRIGRAVTVEVNGKLETVKGELGEPARVLVNGVERDLAAALEDGDEIIFTPPLDGRDATVRLKDLVSAVEEKITINGREYPFTPAVILNGLRVRDMDMVVPDRAKVKTLSMRPLRELLEEAGFGEDALEGSINYSINGQRQSLYWPRFEAKVKGNPADGNTPVAPGDSVTLVERKKNPVLADVLDQGDYETAIDITLNGKPFRLPVEREVFLDGKPAGLSEVLVDGADIRVEKSEGPFLSDLFRHYDPRRDGSGTRLVMEVNGLSAGFDTPIRPGDRVKISLEDQKQAG